eukprot:c25276_g3_i14 orf=97-285(+)
MLACLLLSVTSFTKAESVFRMQSNFYSSRDPSDKQAPLALRKSTFNLLFQIATLDLFFGEYA